MREKALSKEKPKMQMQTKSAYLSKMKYIFKRNEQLNIVFDSIEIVQHPDPGLENIYGVTMKQFWNTAEYYDVGYVFLLLNCSRKEQIEILVSAWQPEEELKSHSDIFGLSHFIIELNK
jgi:hypothetical protein